MNFLVLLRNCKSDTKGFVILNLMVQVLQVLYGTIWLIESFLRCENYYPRTKLKEMISFSSLKISSNESWVIYYYKSFTMGGNSLWRRIHNFIQPHFHEIIIKKSCYLWSRRKIFVKSLVYRNKKCSCRKYFYPLWY